MRGEPTRDQLQRALHESGCPLDLDQAMADPLIARLLTLAATATENPSRRTPRTASEPCHWAEYLRRMVGDTDYQLLRAQGTDLD